MFPSFFLSLREGLEAALIIGVLLSALSKLDRNEMKATIWLGAGAAFVLSIAVGWILNLLGASFEGRAEQIFEGIAMLLAAGILTWTVLWMQAQASSVSAKLEAGAKAAVMKDSQAALFTLAFVSVFREGLELALFLTAASISADGSQVLIGTVLGLAAVVVIAVLLFRSLIRLKLANFFTVTSILLIIFAAGLTAHGVHEFNEAGIIPGIIDHVWDVNHILDENSTVGLLLKVLVGYNGNPSLTEVISYILYLGLIFIITSIMKPKKKSLFENIL